MAFGYLEKATKMLQENVGKYVTIYHKWNQNNEDMSFDSDECVVKIIGVTPVSLLVPTPYVEVQFANGKTARMDFAAEYHGHLLLYWDYQRFGRLFNDFFVRNEEGQWTYTYPDAKSGEVLKDFYLKTGIHHITFYDSIQSEKNAVVNYMSHLEEAEALRIERRREFEFRNSNKITRLNRMPESIKVSDIDKIFHTA